MSMKTLSATQYGKRIGLPTTTVTWYIRKYGLPAKKVRHGLAFYYEINVDEADRWFREHPEIVIDYDFNLQ